MGHMDDVDAASDRPASRRWVRTLRDADRDVVGPLARCGEPGDGGRENNTNYVVGSVPAAIFVFLLASCGTNCVVTCQLCCQLCCQVCLPAVLKTVWSLAQVCCQLC
jgi:hypothetical protein